MHKFGDTKLSIEQKRPVFISGTITIRPVNYDATFLGIAVTATKGDTTLVLADSKSPNGSLLRGSGDGPYGRPRPDAYTTFPVSGVLMLPEAGEWNLQFLLENVSQSIKITVHTLSLTAIAL